MKIAMACDHGGLRLKNVLKEDLEKNGYEVVDFGCRMWNWNWCQHYCQ